MQVGEKTCILDAAVPRGSWQPTAMAYGSGRTKVIIEYLWLRIRHEGAHFGRVQARAAGRSREIGLREAVERAASESIAGDDGARIRLALGASRERAMMPLAPPGQ